MTDSLVEKVAERHIGMSKTAGEVRFIKDRGGDSKEWGWGSPGPSDRTIQENFEFNPKNLKPLARVLRASLIAMGHVVSAHNDFAKIKSAQVSPDGALGGKGYIQKITDMRRQYMNCVEALSALTDTLYDEMKAPHWNPAVKEQNSRERDEVSAIMNNVEEIRDDPEGFAEKEESEMDADEGFPKTASTTVDHVITNVVARYHESRRV